MRFSIFSLLILLLVSGLADLYIYRAVKSRAGGRWPRIAVVGSAIAGILLLIAIALMPLRGGSDVSFHILTWLLLVYFSVYAGKYLYVIIDLIANIPRLFGHGRIRAVSILGAALGTMVFLIIWWGALINRYRIDIVEVTAPVDGLPDAFDGYRIAQISDFHVGTYVDDTTFVDKVVDRINSLDADLVVFTGDIVNRHADEIIPFLSSLNRVHGRDGQLAILGNHDYSDYYDWDSDSAKIADREKLHRLYALTSFDLLLDEHRIIRRGNDSIVVIGVENIGSAPFPIYGSLMRAYPVASDSVTKILLSHDPDHWLDSIADNPKINIALTLSGHTHAMQVKFGRFSPASFAHPRAWAGSYTDTLGHMLYINIGLGTVGAPIRIGATPEITLITLRKK